MSILAEHELPELGSPSRLQSFHDQNLYFEKKRCIPENPVRWTDVHLTSVLKERSFWIFFDQQLSKKFHRETQYSWAVLTIPWIKLLEKDMQTWKPGHIYFSRFCAEEAFLWNPVQQYCKVKWIVLLPPALFCPKLCGTISATWQHLCCTCNFMCLIWIADNMLNVIKSWI